MAFSASAHLPHDPWTTRVRTMFALSRRRFAEAIDLLRAATHGDPYSPWLQAGWPGPFTSMGKPPKASSRSESALDLFADHEFTQFYGALILAYNGETKARHRSCPSA